MFFESLRLGPRSALRGAHPRCYICAGLVPSSSASKVLSSWSARSAACCVSAKVFRACSRAASAVAALASALLTLALAESRCAPKGLLSAASCLASAASSAKVARVSGEAPAAFAATATCSKATASFAGLGVSAQTEPGGCLKPPVSSLRDVGAVPAQRLQ